jgi:hypothetical protein
MGKRVSKEDFIKRAIDIHGDNYCYSDINFINMSTKIIIKCNTCGEYFEKVPSAHVSNKKTGCYYCTNSVILEKNSIYKTNPEVLKYIKNIDDAKKVSKGSNKKILCVCNICKEEKMVLVRTLVNTSSFSCECSSDNISFGEKFIYNILKYLNINFIKEKTFEWSDKKRYDFYFPEHSAIVELHGSQHYLGSGFTGKTLEFEQLNDKNKYDNAMKNNIKIYEIVNISDVSFSAIMKEINKNVFIKNIIGDIDDDKLKELYKLSSDNIFLEVCKYWENRIDKKESIEDIFKKGIFPISTITFRRYLHKGNEIGICSYNPKESRIGLNGKKVSMYSADGELLDTRESARAYSKDGYDNSSISKCCRGLIKSYKGFVFRYV